MSEEEAEQLRIPPELDILPLAGVVIYPQTVVPMAVAQPQALRLLGGADSGPRLLGLLALRPEAGQPDAPTGEDCFRIGTVALVHRLLRLPDGTIRVAVEGLERFVVETFLADAGGLRARIRLLDDRETVVAAEELDALRALAGRAVGLIAGFDRELVAALAEEQRGARLLGMIARVALAQRPLAERQNLLELADAAGGVQLLRDRLHQDIVRIEHLSRRSDGADRAPSVSRCSWLTLAADGAQPVQIECLALRGSGRLLLSGQRSAALADAALLAHSWLRGMGGQLALALPDALSIDLHVHMRPALAATDGASAGLALAVSMAAAAAGQQLDGGSLLVGEITLDGRVLPVAGLRERVAAIPSGYRRLFVPVAQRDAVDTATCEVRGVATIGDVFASDQI